MHEFPSQKINEKPQKLSRDLKISLPWLYVFKLKVYCFHDMYINGNFAFWPWLNLYITD